VPGNFGERIDMAQSLSSLFHPMLVRWFEKMYGEPTAVQTQAWQAIAGGGHVLLTAPTGSGKTLAAFLWGLDGLITGRWAGGSTRLLYVSPLKALNNDVRRNLLTPLKTLRGLFEQSGLPFPQITVATRSGDTTQAERRRMLRQPPEILITTPESLNLLLSSAGGRTGLTTVRTVILDEVHAILGSRRGTYLMTAVERLTRLSGEFQRIALSATVRPLEVAARFAGGYLAEGASSGPRYIPRPVTLITPGAVKTYALQVRQPEALDVPETDPKAFWVPYARQLKSHVRANRATLIFTNSRQLCEKLTLLLNTGEGQRLAYSHHGSLSREIRRAVEKNLKAGLLKAIVATGSLELGIDIGVLDEVVLVQSPTSVAEAVQRVGRAGHGVGETSRGTFYPSHPMDIVTAAVLVQAVESGEIEAVQPIAAPLDVLAQVLVSMCAFETWTPDALYAFIRTAQPYHALSRRQFDLVLDLLEGRYQQARLRELQPRIIHDRVDRALTVKKGALLTLYTSGGVIPDRGYYGLRHAETGARIGELDEEFVWEARIGQVFTLGAQNWRIQKITSGEVLARPAPRGKPAPPFWKAENSGRGFHLSDRIGRFLEAAEADAGMPAFDQRLRQAHHLDDLSRERLIAFLQRQRAHTGCALPHRHHLVLEFTTLGPGGADGNQVVWHTLWGGRVNRPLAVALEAAWEETFGPAPRIFASNDSISFVLPHEVEAEEMLGLVRADRIEELLHRRLAATGFFGARFRECAGRALLLPRQRINLRMPLWLSRLRAQKLLAAVAGYRDFPILAETWRTCLQDEFDLPTLRRLLEELEQGIITWTAVRTTVPSPLARSSAWHPINEAMYATDQGAPARTGDLMDDLLYEITLDPDRRPRIDPRLAVEFEKKRQRLAPGYSPDSSAELLDWVKERVAVPGSEWRALLAAMERDHGVAARDFAGAVADKLVRWRPADGGQDQEDELILAREVLPRWMAAFHGDPPAAMTLLSGNDLQPSEWAGSQADNGDADLTPRAAMVAQWLRFYGPRESTEPARLLGMRRERLQPVLDELAEARLVVAGPLLQAGDAHAVCDRENFEVLLRLARRQAAPVFEALAVQALPLFLARFQGLTRSNREPDDLVRRLDQLLGWPALAGLWETDLLPVRLAGYRPESLDRLMQESELLWLGAGGGKVLFCYESELELMVAHGPPAAMDQGEEKASGADGEIGFFPDPAGRYPFSVLERGSGIGAAELNRRLWAAVWEGRVSNDAFAALRRGIETRFKLPAAPEPDPGVWGRPRPGRRGARSAFAHRRAARAGIGNWYRIPYPHLSADPIDTEERNKERVHLLLDRYGIVFRELLARESPLLQWRPLFRTLRLMELAGEVQAGHFFQGVQGLQFISPRAFNLLQRDLPRDAIYWVNALDPASPCGLGLEALQSGLPRRLPGCHLVYHGTALVLVSQQQGKRLDIRVPSGHARLAEYLAFLQYMLDRPVCPLRSLRVETINNAPAVHQASYLAVLERLFEVVGDPKGVSLYLRH
jgi:ATP-dependent helicase Lhr and Lhr-like helicase